jgi:hypothetical protein
MLRGQSFLRIPEHVSQTQTCRLAKRENLGSWEGGVQGARTAPRQEIT